MTIQSTLPSISEAAGYGALLLGAELYFREEERFRELQRGVPLFVAGPAEFLAPALAAGCADYLREPWEQEELLARLSRRMGRERFVCGGRELLLLGERLEAEGRGITLEPGEARMLRALLRAGGAPVERAFLAILAGSTAGGSGGSRAVDARVSRLRKKLRSFLSNGLAREGIIRSEYGKGYYVDCG